MPMALVHQKTHTWKSFYIFVKKTVFNNQCPWASFLIFYWFTKDFKKNCILIKLYFYMISFIFLFFTDWKMILKLVYLMNFYNKTYVSVHNLFLIQWRRSLIFHIFIGLRCFSKNSGFVDVTGDRYVLNVNSSLDEQLSSGISWVHLRENLILSVTLNIS